MTLASPSWVGQTVDAGRYAVTGLVGEGGMASIYQATDTKRSRGVVLKVPKPALLADPDFVHRFVREIRTLVELKHPAIVTVLGCAKHNDIPFAVLEHMTGGSLADRPKNCPLNEITPWLPEIAAALDHCHAAGYVHRDVKPANILFDGQGKARLSDFGIIKAINEKAGTTKALTESGMALGTPEYIAPELAKGEKFDGRVDQYALAVTVFEMLAGCKPIEGKTSMAILVNQVRLKPKTLDEVVANVPSELSAVIARALAKDPRKRFGSCTEFASAVIAAINTEETKDTLHQSHTAEIRTVEEPKISKSAWWVIVSGIAALTCSTLLALTLFLTNSEATGIVDQPVPKPNPGPAEPQPISKQNLIAIEPIYPNRVAVIPGQLRRLTLFIRRNGVQGDLLVNARLPAGINIEPLQPLVKSDSSEVEIRLIANPQATSGPAEITIAEVTARFAIEVQKTPVNPKTPAAKSPAPKNTSGKSGPKSKNR